ncbi:hypothetical protein ACFIC9_002544 [Salmonella enterica]
MCNENEFLFNSDYLNRFFPKDSDGYNISQLVFYFGFFFPDGYKSEYRNKVIAVSEEYWSLCGSELKWMTDPHSLHWKKSPETMIWQNGAQPIRRETGAGRWFFILAG